MKTYEEMTESIIKKTEQRKKALLKKKRRLSLIAAVAAALILFTALPVGAFIISRQAKQPAEIPAPEQTSTVSLDTISKETVEMHETILETENDPVTSSYIPVEPELPDCMELYFGFEKYDINESGTTQYFTCLLTPSLKDEYIGFQVNMTSPEGIIFDCGPVFFNTDMSDYGLSELPVNQRHYHKEIGFFIPNDIDYGEIHIYLNLLHEEGETVTDFASDPHIQRCFSFAKYGDRSIIVNHGIEKPTRSKDDMLQGAAAEYEKTIYEIVNYLLLWNFADENFNLIEDKDDPRDLSEDTLLSKHQDIEFIEIYRIDHEERFQEILRQVITDRENEKRKIREYFEEHGEDVSSEPLTRNDPHQILTRVDGTLRWKFADTAGTTYVLPAKSISIKCYSTESGSDILLGSTFSNETGYFNLSFYLSDIDVKNIKIVASLESCNIKVKEFSSTEPYSKDVFSQSNVSAGDDVTCGIIYFRNNYTDNVFNKATSIHQALIMANNYIYRLESAYMSPIDVNYPRDYNGASYFSSSEMSINISIGRPYTWDAVQHEFGHYVAYTYSLIGSYAGSSTHYINVDLSSLPEEGGGVYGKEKGIKMAWSEGFVTFFAINLQRVMGASSLGIPDIGNNCYDAGSTHFNIETMTYTSGTGTCDICESNEMTIAGILYDFADPIDYSDNDRMCFDDPEIWLWLKTNHSIYLGMFLSYFENNSGCSGYQITAAGYDLEWFGLSATNPYISYYSNGLPHFTWTAPAYADNNTYLNYTLYFYDLSYNYITHYGFASTNDMTVPANYWNNITNGRTEFYVVVAAYNYDSGFLTGPFYSHPYKITLP